KDGIQVVSVPSSAETRCCHTLIDRAGRMQTELVEEAAAVNPDLVRKTNQLYRRHLARCSIVVLSGTVPPGFPESVYAGFIEQAGRVGKPVVLDASGAPLLRTLDRKVMLVKPNRTELESLSGISLDSPKKIYTVMKDICSHGPEAVLMTDQEKEAWFFHEDVLYRVHVPALEAVNPIGSGDAVTAGFALARIRGLDFIESVRYAAACGCANVLTPLAGHVQREAAETLLPAIQIEMVIS
ncbi:bifunctional hydroxymethylpyrimidine kinase/phosphomethylpyrimidine kinase, partial [bacterium]|nr:bifunctional hydroxymethylpyrimidine kinase/phosphomethylpyrimidine kinase [bacterium]